MFFLTRSVFARYGRPSMIFCEYAAPIPGSVLSCSLLAEFRSISDELELAVELLLEAEVLAAVLGLAAGLVEVLVWPEPSVTKAAKPKTTNIAADRIRLLLINNPPGCTFSLTASFPNHAWSNMRALRALAEILRRSSRQDSNLPKAGCPFSKVLAGCREVDRFRAKPGIPADRTALAFNSATADGSNGI